jgi:hypothetical protein
MPKYSPEVIDFGFTEYNLKEITLSAAKQDGMYMGKLLMKNEIKSIINKKHPKPTKAIQELLLEIEQIKIDHYANDSVR